MRNSVKSSREVEEDENTDLSGVSSEKEVISDLEEGGLCAVMCSVG